MSTTASGSGPTPSVSPSCTSGKHILSAFVSKGLNGSRRCMQRVGGCCCAVVLGWAALCCDHLETIGNSARTDEGTGREEKRMERASQLSRSLEFLLASERFLLFGALCHRKSTLCSLLLSVTAPQRAWHLHAFPPLTAAAPAAAVTRQPACQSNQKS